MKKVLFTVAALGLAAGIATSASALELKVKGDYTVDGFYIDKGMGAAAYDGVGGRGVQLANDFTNPLLADVETNSDAWLQHMFNIEAEMVVNDKISMKSRIRLIDWGTVWGEQDDTDVNNGHNMSVERLWMVYKSPIGVWEIGRRPASAWGLSFVDKATAGDRIFWGSGKLMGEQLSAYAFYQKMVENEAYYQDTDDMDSDYYELGATMKGGWGSATLGYGLTLNNSTNVDHSEVGENQDINLDGLIGQLINGQMVDRIIPASELTVHRFKGVGQFKFGGNMGLDTEFDYQIGEKDYNVNTLTRPDQDIERFAFIADFYATMDALTAHAMYFHISGDDNSALTTDIENYGGTGSDFEPLYILTGVFGNILNQDQGGLTTSFGGRARTAGADAMVLSGDFAATQDLTLHAGFGYAVADKEMAGYEDDYGFEYNAGAAYKLVDNLIYAVHLGYLDTGDFFKLGTTYKDVNNIFLASHHLTMSF